MWIISRCIGDKDQKSTGLQKQCQTKYERATNQFYYSDFKMFKDPTKKNIQYQFKEVQLLNEDRYSQQVLNTNNYKLQGLLLKVSIQKIGGTVSQGLLKTRYKIFLSQNFQYVSFYELRRDLIKANQNICDINPKLGVNYLKFLFKYFQIGFLLDLFCNQFLYIQKPDPHSLGRIYIFNQKFFSVKRIPIQKMNQPKRMRELIRDFFMVKQQKNYLSKFVEAKSKIMESKSRTNYQIKFSKYHEKDLELIQNILQILQKNQKRYDEIIQRKKTDQISGLMKELFSKLHQVIQSNQKASFIATTVENESEKIISRSSKSQSQYSQQMEDNHTRYQNSLLQRRRSLDLKDTDPKLKQVQVSMQSGIK